MWLYFVLGQTLQIKVAAKNIKAQLTGIKI